MSNIQTDLISGLSLPVMEEFYSLQGEGFNTGKAAYFLRIGGCDVGCKWCDVKESWNPKWHPLVKVDDVINRARTFQSRSVVVTGGEPLLYNLDYLCAAFRKEGFQLFLETSGSEKISGEWDWICLSPKKNAPPVESMCNNAHELKVIISDDSDFDWAEKYASLVSLECKLYMQPEWSQIKIMMPKIIDYILMHPKWTISLQSHKYMNIP